MKVGLFFGAGAEISYGLPSGGKFAIDLFRKDPTPYKKAFRAKLLKINSRSPYANTWLPKGYEKKSIFAFGKNEFTSITNTTYIFSCYNGFNTLDCISDFYAYMGYGKYDKSLKRRLL